MHVLTLNDGTTICPGGLEDVIEIVGEKLSRDLSKFLDEAFKQNNKKIKEMELELDGSIHDVATLEEENEDLERENESLLQKIEELELGE